MISQNRNSTDDVLYGPVGGPLTSVPAGGSMNLLVGESYDIRLDAGTATQGYEQLQTFLTLPNTIFQITAVETVYSADSSPHVPSPNDTLYANACLWENDPNSPNYLACLESGLKAGGSVTTTYTVTIISGGGTTQTLNSLIYDFSGSSFHYNTDFAVAARFANIIDPTSAGISKRFVPDTISQGGTSTLIITLTNPNAGAVSGYNFTDPLPSGVSVANPANATTNGCGTPTFAPNPSDTTLTFSNGTVAANGTCTISVSVTGANLGAQLNTTNNLFVGTQDTGKSASATLTVTNQPLPPACTSGLPLATWTFEPTSTTVPPAPDFQASSVTTATTGFTPLPALPGTNNINTAEGNTAVNSWEGTGWQAANDNTAVTANSTSYFSFDLDTSNFNTQPVVLSLDVNPDNGWANPNNNEIYIWASVDGGGYSLLTGAFIPVSRGTWNAIGPLNMPSAGDTLSIRITAKGRSNGTADANLLLDDIEFTGCGIPDPPTLAKAFSPNPIGVGGVSTLTFTLTNTNTTVALTGAAFTDDLPTGVTVANPTNASTTCGGTWAPAAGTTSLTFSGGTIPINGTCTVQVDVTSSTPGPSTNVSGFISSTQTGQNTGPGGSASATLTVVAAPQISKLFSPNPILANGVSTLTFTITNPNQNDAISGVAFVDTLPATPGSMVIANPNNIANTCNGTPTATAGTNVISLTGGTIAAASSCTISVDITAPTEGTYMNQSDLVSHSVGGTTFFGNTASDDLVVEPPAPDVRILKQVGLSATGPWFSYIAVAPGTNVFYQITIENAGDVPLTPVTVTDNLINVSGCTWTDPLPVAVAANDNHIDTCVVGPVNAVSGTTTNTATVNGTFNSTVYTDTDTATYATTGLSIDKQASPSTFTQAGDVISYTFTVVNTGNAILSGPVTIVDDKATDEACPALTTVVPDSDNFFDPGEQIVCTASYTILAGDVTAGSVTNIATASAGGATSPQDQETVTLSAPGTQIGVAKSAGTPHQQWRWYLHRTDDHHGRELQQ